MRSHWIIPLVLIFALSLSAGCSHLAGMESEAAEKKEKPKVYVILKTLSSPYWKFVEAGARQAFEDYGVDGEVMGPASESQVMEQVNMLQDVLMQDPDALVLAPTQPPTVISTLEKYKTAGIPVLFIDTDAEWKGKKTFIGTDNRTAGKKGGKLLASKLEKGDKVALISGALGNTTTDLRIEGAEKTLEKAGLNVVVKQPGDSDKMKAMTVMQNALQSHPDIKGVFAANDDMALGALRALDAKDIKIPVVGTDGTIEAVGAIQRGDMAGTVAQNPYKMGYIGVENALKSMKGKKVEKRIDSGVSVIKEKNAEKSLKRLKSYMK